MSPGLITSSCQLNLQHSHEPRCWEHLPRDACHLVGTIMPKRKCTECGGEMERMNDTMGKPITVTPPDSDRPVPAELWICHGCQSAVFLLAPDA